MFFRNFSKLLPDCTTWHPRGQYCPVTEYRQTFSVKTHTDFRIVRLVYTANEKCKHISLFYLFVKVIIQVSYAMS
jgi:hypothetical protein